MSILLEPIVTLGRIMALVPLENRGALKALQRALSLSLVTFATYATISWIYHSTIIFPTFTVIKAAITILHHLTLWLLNTYILTVIALFKRDQWCELLKRVRRLVNRPKVTARAVATIFFIHAAYLTVAGYGYANVKINFPQIKPEDFVGVIVQSYYRFFYTVFMSILLKVILDAYVDLQVRLTGLVKSHRARGTTRVSVLEDLLKDIETRYYSLGGCVDLVNDLFGWPFLLTILYTTLFSLDYVDDFFFDTGNLTGRQLTCTYVSNIGLVLFDFFQYSLLALLCDSIVGTARRIFVLSHNLYRVLEISPGDKAILGEFIESGLKQLPQFSAAGYFTVNKFNIATNFWLIITFLVIMIQFDTSFITNK